MPYTVTPTAIPEVLILEPKLFGDSWGFFFESFNARDFAQVTGLPPQLAAKMDCFVAALLAMTVMDAAGKLWAEADKFD